MHKKLKYAHTVKSEKNYRPLQFVKNTIASLYIAVVISLYLSGVSVKPPTTLPLILRARRSFNEGWELVEGRRACFNFSYGDISAIFC